MTKTEFYEQIEGWISQPQESWNHVTLMAYFYYKYKEKTGLNFIPASWKSNPALTKESKDFSKLFNIWAPDDYDKLDKESKSKARFFVNQKIYNYINWVFYYKFRYVNKAVTGTGLFLNNNLLNEFEIIYSAHLKKSKGKNGIEALVKWAKLEIPDVLDNHQLDRVEDLEMLSKYISMYNLDEMSSEYKIIAKAKELNII